MEKTFSNNKINNNDDNKQWQHSNKLGKVDPLTKKIKHQKIMMIVKIYVPYPDLIA